MEPNDRDPVHRVSFYTDALAFIFPQQWPSLMTIHLQKCEFDSPLPRPRHSPEIIHRFCAYAILGGLSLVLYPLWCSL